MKCDTCPYRSHPGTCLGIGRKCEGEKTLPDRPTARRMPSVDGRVRVGLWCPCLISGGAEAWQLALGRYTDPTRVEWVGCCLIGENAPISPEMSAATSKLMPVSFGRQAARSLAARCDIVVTWAIEDIPSLLDGLQSPPKVIAAIHTPAQNAWGLKLYSQTAGIDRWVAVSELALEALPESSRHIPHAVIWNAVDCDRLAVRRDRSEMRRVWGVAEDAPVAGFIGRLAEEKDPFAMVRLASHLPDPWRVVVVGQGALRMEAGAPPNLILAGSDLAAGDVLNALDVLVVPSHYESFGLTMAEGLVMGLPIVSTEVGLAKMVAGITTLIPIHADGPTIAAAVLTAKASPRAEAIANLIPRLQPDRFGREWSDLFCSMAGEPTRKPAFDVEAWLAVRAKVEACEHRGPQVLACGCTRSRICLAGQGRPIPDRPGLTDVTDADCRACVSG